MCGITSYARLSKMGSCQLSTYLLKKTRPIFSRRCWLKSSWVDLLSYWDSATWSTDKQSCSCDLIITWSYHMDFWTRKTRGGVLTYPSTCSSIYHLLFISFLSQPLRYCIISVPYKSGIRWSPTSHLCMRSWDVSTVLYTFITLLINTTLLVVLGIYLIDYLCTRSWDLFQLRHPATLLCTIAALIILLNLTSWYYSDICDLTLSNGSTI